MKKNLFFSVFAGICLLLATANGFAQRGPGPGPGPGATTTSYDTHFTSWHFSGSGNCSLCHNGLSDPNGRDVSIETAWSSTLMAHATRDPLWQAKVRSELLRNPGLADTLNNKCSRCHAPMANTEAAHNRDLIQIFGSGGFLDPNSLHFHEAMDAVSCTLCHQIMDSPVLGTLAGFSGNYEIGTFPVPEERLIYGHYGNVLAPPMHNQVQYSILYSDHVLESKACAACHNLKTPYVDENGNLLTDNDPTTDDEFPEQMPYSEWEHSSYAAQQSCQDCHLPRVDGVPIASRPMWLPLRNNFATHDMVGGNLLLLDILDSNRADLGVFSDNFPATVVESEKLLQQAASLEMVESSLVGGTLEFTLRVSSNTGHKLPSGIPLRRVILHVTVYDNRDNVVFESGRVNPDGSIAEVDADLDSSTFEPHHDLITAEDQVQVYEAVMQDNHEEVTYTLLRAMNFWKDNRLLPDGFDKETAGSDIEVVGLAQSDSNFLGGSDTLSYSIGGLTRNRYRVAAELLFQPVSYAFVQDLTQDSAPEIEAFYTMFNASGQKTTQIGLPLKFTVVR